MVVSSNGRTFICMQTGFTIGVLINFNKPFGHICGSRCSHDIIMHSKRTAHTAAQKGLAHAIMLDKASFFREHTPHNVDAERGLLRSNRISVATLDGGPRVGPFCMHNECVSMINPCHRATPQTIASKLMLLVLNLERHRAGAACAHS